MKDIHVNHRKQRALLVLSTIRAVVLMIAFAANAASPMTGWSILLFGIAAIFCVWDAAKRWLRSCSVTNDGSNS